MAWISYLITEPEGSSFISRTVAHRRVTDDARDTRPIAEVRAASQRRRTSQWMSKSSCGGSRPRLDCLSGRPSFAHQRQQHYASDKAHRDDQIGIGESFDLRLAISHRPQIFERRGLAADRIAQAWA